MDIEFDLLTPLESSDLKGGLLEMPLFLYESRDWSDWWSYNLKRPRTVLKHQDHAFAEGAENAITKGVRNPLDAISQLRKEFRERVECPHRMQSIDVKIDPLFLTDGRLGYKGFDGEFVGGQNELSLYNFKNAIESHTGAGIREIFGQEAEASRLGFSLSVDFHEKHFLTKRRGLRRYARDFVGQLRQNEVPFYALWSPNCVLSYVIAVNSLGHGYSTDFSKVSPFNRTLRGVFRA